jgi:hypothetical protein
MNATELLRRCTHLHPSPITPHEGGLLEKLPALGAGGCNRQKTPSTATQRSFPTPEPITP